MLNKAISMPDKIQDDKRVKEEAKQLLKQVAVTGVHSS